MIHNLPQQKIFFSSNVSTNNITCTDSHDNPFKLNVCKIQYMDYKSLSSCKKSEFLSEQFNLYNSWAFCWVWFLFPSSPSAFPWTGLSSVLHSKCYTLKKNTFLY